MSLRSERETPVVGHGRARLPPSRGDNRGCGLAAGDFVARLGRSLALPRETPSYNPPSPNGGTGRGVKTGVDEFVGFNFVLLDASRAASQKVAVEQKGQRRERVDVIARQFRDALREGDPADASPRGLMLTHDFKIRRGVGESAGWVAFLVDRGDGTEEKLEEVALVVYARADTAEARQSLRKLDPYVNVSDLPPAPLVVAVKLAAKVPPIVREWYGKAVAGMFAERT